LRRQRDTTTTFHFQIEHEDDTPDPAPASDLAPAVLLGDRGHVEAREGPHVADGPAGGRSHERHDLLARQRRDDVRDARIGGARGVVHLPQQIELPREVRDYWRLGVRVEVVRPAAWRYGHPTKG